MHLSSPGLASKLQTVPWYLQKFVMRDDGHWGAFEYQTGERECFSKKECRGETEVVLETPDYRLFQWATCFR